MKKIIAIALSVLAALALVGCSTQPAEAVKLATLKGPTGMGMVQLFDMEDKYDVTLAGAPDEITGMLSSGEVDIAAVPINLAGVLYNKTEGDVLLLAAGTLGVLYVLEDGTTVNSMADLSGKTLMATGQGSTPEYILQFILNANGLADAVTVEYVTEHSELATMMAAGDVKLGMLPEPNVSTVLAKNANMRVALDLTQEWAKVSDTQLIQTGILVRKEYYEANKAAVDTFLKDYKASVDFVNTDLDAAADAIVEVGIIPSAAIAKSAIPNCNIVLMDGEEMKTAAAGMFDVLFAANPKSVGGKLPGDDFYVMN